VERHGRGHRPARTKEVSGSGRVHRVSVEEGAQSVDSRPVVYLVDESVFDRVGRDVHELVHHVLILEEVDDADLLAGPEVLPPPAQRILALGQELMKMLGERRIGTITIEDDSMVMIRHCAREEHLDAGPLCSDSEAVEESVVGVAVGAQQELSLRAATRDHVEPTGNDLARAHGRSPVWSCRIVIIMRRSRCRKLANDNIARTRRGRGILSGVRPDDVRIPDKSDSHI
jgi:hypothetical protein